MTLKPCRLSRAIHERAGPEEKRSLHRNYYERVAVEDTPRLQLEQLLRDVRETPITQGRGCKDRRGGVRKERSFCQASLLGRA